MTPTTWTEKTAPETAYFEGIPSPLSGSIEGYAMLDIVIPISGGLAFADTTTAWTERTAPAASYSELTAPAVAWTEKVA